MIYDTDLDIKHRDFHNGKLWEKLDIPTMIGISWNMFFFSVYATRIKRAMDKCDINADLAMKIGHQRGH